ncbi:MAG: tetratricopeptide repeat protein, partial [Rhodobacteraceae bacterium]|nr:tetratricopeptide repeat protein [Paracoccaceae bacterium]
MSSSRSFSPLTLFTLFAFMAAALTLSGCEQEPGAAAKRYDPQLVAENDALRAASDTALQAEDAEAALAASEALLAHAEKAFGVDDSYTAIAWNERGYALSLAKREPDAAAAHQRSLEIEQGREPPNPMVLTVALGNLAKSQGRLGRLNKALETAEAAVTQARAARSLRGDDEDLIWALEVQGGAHSLNGAPEAAANAYNEALELLPEAREADQLRLTALLGRYLFEAKRAEEALPHLQAAVALREKLEGTDSITLQYDLNLLGDALAALKRPDEAEAAYLRDLAISKAAEGDDSLNVAVTQEDLGQLYVKQDRDAEAAAAFERALEIRTDTQGADHLNLASIRYSLAHSYWRLKRIDEAAALFERDAASRALTGDQAGVGQVWHDLGELRREAGDYKAARSAFGAALAALQSAHGDDNELTAVTKRALADVEAALQRAAEAEATTTATATATETETETETAEGAAQAAPSPTDTIAVASGAASQATESAAETSEPAAERVAAIAETATAASQAADSAAETATP